LKRAEDRAIFERPLGATDVLVENFRPGVLARLGYVGARELPNRAVDELAPRCTDVMREVALLAHADSHDGPQSIAFDTRLCARVISELRVQRLSQHLCLGPPLRRRSRGYTFAY
jgi:hypothetical protein